VLELEELLGFTLEIPHPEAKGESLDWHGTKGKIR